MKLMNKNLSIVLIIFSIFVSVYFIFFKKWDVREAIADYTNEHCQINQECLIDLSKITPFHWDRAYIFPTGTRPKSIEKAIGMHYQFIDVGVKFIFIKNKKIVYFEEYFPYPDYRDKNQIVPNFASLLYPESNFPEYYFLTKENSQLFIKRYHGTSSKRKRNMFYEISPSNENQSEKNNLYKE
ncbi:hypothetical protein [Photorhabdus hainanensis]|uniref:hypothetical protein n=1 Tax=Photorhabdus hainanensis TaxID=1004166 RepID=UPI001BD54061|nr:hypothetical protein [Photorhabdus hainanensis]MBS9435365.1 hypothetical protein [Photorhabdus hainanensis]